MDDPKLFMASGLNDSFHGTDLNFEDYCKQTQTMIGKARLDLTATNRDTVLSANSPFQWEPSNNTTHSDSKKYRKGILLVHGMSDSPFILKEMGEVFLAHGFFVQSILLPGHGTRPGDLLNVTHEEWIKSVKYGIETLKYKAENIFIVGFSLGATLSINLALDDPSISGLILLAPAMRIRKHFLATLAKQAKFLTQFFPKFKWLSRVPQDDYSKYESLTYNSGEQTLIAIDKTQQKLQKKSLTIPMFVTFSTDDETISPEAIVKFFSQNTHPKNKMLVYGNSISIKKTKNIEIRTSRYMEQKILDFSHVTLPSSPNNPHYGVNGDYKDFLHYPDKKPPSNENIFLGAPSRKNLQRYVIQRLRYNPDFDGMMGRILEFLE